MYLALNNLINRLDARIQKNIATEPKRGGGFVRNKRIASESSNNDPPVNTPAWSIMNLTKGKN